MYFLNLSSMVLGMESGRNIIFYLCVDKILVAGINDAKSLACIQVTLTPCENT